MFDDVASYMWLIPALSLVASAVTAFLGPGLLRERSHWPCIIAAVCAFILSVGVLVGVVNDPRHMFTSSVNWFHIGPAGGPDIVDVGITFRADGLTAIMLVTVTFIGTLIAIYSAGYMHGDPGYARYFAEIALFLFSMTGLVLAENFFLLYAFWEGVGVCSYLLIGFWFAKPSAAAAARKAFLVTRLGDIGLLIGILALWFGLGYGLDYDSVFRNAPGADRVLVTAACLLLFCGAVGKSAQFPLHVWLPDAMEGPSPVSALIHAATMVTAGVYLVARCTPLFVLAPVAQITVACIGTFTALLAALMAIAQSDLKRVLAYSTISQLGYMFLALGSGVGDLAHFAVMAAIFHLFTHAFFKALLFLSAGSVMHAMGNVIDMRRFSGLRRLLPTTHWTFLCGAGALAGIPLLSGFWSKDDILDATYHETAFYWIYWILLAVGLLTAGLTAFYTFRAYFLTFWGEERIPPEAGHHAHEAPPVMLWPLRILAVGAVFAGIIVEPFTHWLSKLLDLVPGLEGIELNMNWGMMALSTLLALSGVGLAWWLYVRAPALATELAERNEGLYELARNRFYLDDIYSALIVRPLAGFAYLCRVLDLHLLDMLVDFLGRVPRLFGQIFRPIQNGLVQFYALAMVLGLTVFLLSLLLR
jgi:NADH-quinone oxidoreductase subunit L